MRRLFGLLAAAGVIAWLARTVAKSADNSDNDDWFDRFGWLLNDPKWNEPEVKAALDKVADEIRQAEDDLILRKMLEAYKIETIDWHNKPWFALPNLERGVLHNIRNSMPNLDNNASRHE